MVACSSILLPLMLFTESSSLSFSNTQRKSFIRMDDEIPRPGCKVESKHIKYTLNAYFSYETLTTMKVDLTAREGDYLSKRFTKLSNSGHDLTPMENWYKLGLILTRNCHNLTRIFTLGPTKS
jgi:hypothetical protein